MGTFKKETKTTIAKSNYITEGGDTKLASGLTYAEVFQKKLSPMEQAKYVSFKEVSAYNKWKDKEIDAVLSGNQNQSSLSLGAPSNKDILKRSDVDYSGLTFSSEVKRTDLSLKDVVKDKGYDAKPTILSEKDFNKYVEEGGVLLSRGIAGSKGKEYAEAFKSGEFYVNGGEAYYGEGVYAFGGKDAGYASRYANGGGVVVEMSLSKDAKVYEVTSPLGVHSATLEKYFEYEYKGYIGESYVGGTKKVKPEKATYVKEVEDVLNKYTDSSLADKYRDMGYKIPKEIEINWDRHTTEELIASVNRDKEIKEAVKQAGIQELKKSKILSREQMELAVALDSDNKGLDNTTIASMGYDAIRLSRDFVKSNSKNEGEIYIILNRGKVVVNDKIRTQSEYIDNKTIKAFNETHKGMNVHLESNWGSLKWDEAKLLLTSSEFERYKKWLKGRKE